MKWQRRGRSRNLEDRRGARRPGGGFRLPGGRLGGGGRRGGPRLGIGGIVLLVVAYLAFGEQILPLLLNLGGSSVTLPGGAPPVGQAPPSQTSAAEEELVDFVSFVLDDIQTGWAKALPGYRDAKLVLFRGATRSGCGMGQAAMGPFYCPADGKVYVDLGFYEELRTRFRAPGDFAQAYVLAHEIGHHVQAISGIEPKVRRAQRSNPRAKNELSVAMELQADCLAGVWGHGAARRGILEPGDIEEGLRAAAAIGDDRIQSMSGRGVHPESFTHGSSEQRMAWLRRGLEGGDPNACDTFQGRL